MRSTEDTLDCLAVRTYKGHSRKSFVMFSVRLICVLGSYEIVHLCSVQFICIPVLNTYNNCYKLYINCMFWCHALLYSDMSSLIFLQYFSHYRPVTCYGVNISPSDEYLSPTAIGVML